MLSGTHFQFLGFTFTVPGSMDQMRSLHGIDPGFRALSARLQVMPTGAMTGPTVDGGEGALMRL